MTYPNVLVLDYLKKTGKLAPEVRMKAERYIGLGYQRLLTFEVDGGGFSLFGDAPADGRLTAYGLLEINDMARVYNVDPKLIDRTAAWLRGQQDADGGWGDLASTAFATWALVEAGQGQTPEAERALDALRAGWRATEDPYILALIANALGASEDPATAEVLDLTPSTEPASPFVIPAKPRGKGREPGSRIDCTDLASLDSGSRDALHRSSGMTGCFHCDTVSDAKGNNKQMWKEI